MSITLEKLSSMFHMPEKEVAVELGMCLTSLKKIARSFGITRWPYRKLRSLKRTMQKINDDQNCLGSLASVVNTPFPSLDTACSKTEHTSDSNNNMRTSHAIPVSRECLKPVIASSYVKEASAPVMDAEECDDQVLICKVEGTTLSVQNWSVHWTVQSLSNHLLKPLGGTSIAFSSDGSMAELSFTTCMAALQARRVALLASKLVGAQQEEDSESSASSPSEVSSSEAEQTVTLHHSSRIIEAPHSREQLSMWAEPAAHLASVGRSTNFMISPPCSYSFDPQSGFACAPWSASTVWAC